MDYGRPIEDFLDPPALCFHPERKDSFLKNGLIFRCSEIIT